MKWLNRIFGRKEIPSTIAFDGIDAWLDMASGALFRGLSANASQLYGEIEKIRDRLKQNTSELRDAEPTEHIPAPIAKSGLTTRDKMVKHLNYLVEKMWIPTQTDYKTVLSFYRTTTSSMEFALAMSRKNIYCVRSLFPNEVEKVISNLDRLKILLNQLIAPLTEKESQIMNLDRTPEIVRSVKGIKSAIDREKGVVNDREEEAFALEKRIEVDEERMRILEEGEEWIQFKELETKLSSLEKELSMLESDVGKLFSPIDKALKLLKKQDETGRYTLALGERRVLSSILSSPIHVLDENLDDFLRTLQNIIEGDILPLKGRGREKAVRWINSLSDIEISSIKRRHDSPQSEIEETKGRLSNITILKDRREIERTIVSTEGQLTQLREGIERSKRHIVSLEENLAGEVRLLLEALENIAGKKIDVEFDFKTVQQVR
ncbi:MAG: hypothetical protein QMC77_01925 [Methanocellales archaeon]|nr:hypothetical protein [Methanocellales archaeon]